MAEDERTQRWQRLPRAPTESDALRGLRACIAAIRAAPEAPEPRRQLRALAADHGLWEQVALLLSDEARATSDRPAIAVAFYEELVDVRENLDQALETIAAMEAIVALEPARAAHHDRLAWLYRRAGAWEKAAAAFEAVARLAPEQLGRAALRAAARLYHDHRRFEQAAGAYRAIVDRTPSDTEAWRALDEVLTELGRWREVADVRGTLAARVGAGVEKAALLRAQARALEQAGDPAAAAAIVARAADHAPGDVSGIVDHATVLARAGQGREAAELLRARVAEARARGASPDDVAALRARLAGILEDACGDAPAAAAVLEELLADAPRYLPALERLAHHAAGDPAPHAAALLRLAEAMAPGPDQAATVLAAARELRDARHDRAALRAYETATELLPDDDAIRDELDDVRTRIAVAAAAAGARGGDAVGAERGLRALLASRPLHVEANLALADLLAATGRAELAVEHLRATLAAAPEGTPDARLAPVVHRYAVAVAARGDADEAHQLLHEAHRLDRRALPIKLALGDSCFARRLWREAALHLGSLADHPDAPRHAALVAPALVRAALAETRALRPANAEKRYEAAVRLDPACAPAWHALAEIASERGDLARAAECLEHEAAATSQPRERLRLYDALGDLAVGVLGDDARAERCWRAVADAGSAPVLEKLLAVQRRRGVGADIADTCARLAELRPDDSLPLWAEAAAAYVAAGELPPARAIADKLVARHPLVPAALMAATAVTAAERDHARTAGWLRRALTAWEAAGDRGEGDALRAELWRRLGDAHRALADEPSALTAYQTAIATAPRSDSALAARRGVVELAAVSGRDAHSSLFALVEAAQAPADVLAWARELARGADRDRDRADDACAGFELARALGAALSDEDDVFEARFAPRAMASDEAYGGTLEDADRRALIDDTAEGPLAELLEILGEAAALVCPDGKTALAQHGLGAALRLSAGSAAAAAAMYPAIGNALRGPQTLLYATGNTPGAQERGELSVVLAQPPVVVLGPRLSAVRARSHADGGVQDDVELRFALGRGVELARPRRVFALGGSPVAFADRVRALELVGGRAVANASPAATAEAGRLRKLLPVAVRRRIGERLAATSTTALDPEAYRAACARAADRAGLLACGRIDVAIAAAGGPRAAHHLVQLAATDVYRAARRTLRPRRRA